MLLEYRKAQRLICSSIDAFLSQTNCSRFPLPSKAGSDREKMHGRGEKYQQSSKPAEIYHSRSIQLIDLGRTEEVALKRKQDIARPAYWDKSLPECGYSKVLGIPVRSLFMRDAVGPVRAFARRCYMGSR